MERRLQTDLRRMKRLRELGDDPSCAECGIKNPEALTRRKRTLLEAHHIDPNDADDTIILCLTHHRMATELQRQFGVELCRQRRNKPDRIVNSLKSRASIRMLEAKTELNRAEWLESLFLALDAK